MYRSIFMALISITATHNAAARRGAQFSHKGKILRKLGSINPITTRAEYDRIVKATGPTVIVYNSSNCGACGIMQEALAPIAKKYLKADFYKVNMSDKEFKGLVSELKIEGIPTTYFLKKGFKRSEVGTRSQRELDNIVYELVTGKSKVRTIKRKPTSTKK